MATAELKRETFTFSRELEFFSERELEAQMGYSRQNWPCAVIKELVDNAMDACETAGVAPQVSVELGLDCIIVEDNGPGIPANVVAKIPNFLTRTSDKEAYRSPTRGAQGNALKTVLAVSFLLSPDHNGRLVIESLGLRHDIRIDVDPIAQKAIVKHDKEKIVKTGGTRVEAYITIPDHFDAPDFYKILKDYTVLSPHLTLKGYVSENKALTEATDPTWHKWLPTDPTSPHWFSLPDFIRLLSANINLARNGGRDKTLREFVAEFRGLSSTAKQKKITDQFPHIRRLSDLVDGNDNQLDSAQVFCLHERLKAESKPVSPELLGIIGETHFSKKLGTDMKYSCVKHRGDIPFVVEAAFAYTDDYYREFTVGVNFSPTLLDPLSDAVLRATYQTNDLSAYGIKNFAIEHEVSDGVGCHLIVHIVHPALAFRDRGKTRIGAGRELVEAVGRATHEVLKEHYRKYKKMTKEYIEQEKEQRRAAKAETFIPSGDIRTEASAIEYIKFATFLKQEQQSLDIKLSSRGWGYHLEGKGYITKAEIDKVEKAINVCRDFSKLLPYDFVAEEEGRQFRGIETPDTDSPLWFLRNHLSGILSCEDGYTPDWWDGEEYYIQMLVEKIDLVTLFDPICQQYHIPIATSKGWSSKLQRASFARRFKDAEARGLKAILLYCGDHDPSGKFISERLMDNLRQISCGGWEDGTAGYDPSNLIIDRFGLNYDFIVANNLTWIDNLITGGKKDLASPHHRDHYKPYVQDYVKEFGIRKCEANALVAQRDAGRQLAREAIIKYLGDDALDRFQARQDKATEPIRKLREDSGLDKAIREALKLVKQNNKEEV